VRSLEREIGSIAASGPPEGGGDGEGDRDRDPARLGRLSRASPVHREPRWSGRFRVGIANGLAWTEVGGDIMTIEVTIVPGKGKPAPDRKAGAT